MNSGWTQFLQASAPSDHGARVYGDIDELAQSVGTYLAAGFNRCEPAVVVATPEHWSRFAERLAFRGWGEKELEERGLLLFADADETLAAIMVDGSPSQDSFEQVIGELMDQVEERVPGRPIRRSGRWSICSASAVTRRAPLRSSASGTNLRSGEASRSSAPITSTSSIGRRRQGFCPRSAERTRTSSLQRTLDGSSGQWTLLSTRRSGLMQARSMR